VNHALINFTLFVHPARGPTKGFAFRGRQIVGTRRPADDSQTLCNRESTWILVALCEISAWIFPRRVLLPIARALLLGLNRV